MKRLFAYLLVAIALTTAGCSESFDDSKIWEKLDDHESRITALEELCKQMNTNIASLQAIITALENNDYVTSVIPVNKDGETIGYTITFTKSNPITIYHGEDGANGENGADGADGYTPTIGVKQDTDGVYYWTLDGEWLLDTNGNKIKAQGTDGKDGQDGAPGKDGEDGTDGKDGQDGAPGKNGEDGQDGAPGKDGEDGQDGANGRDGITPKLKIENDYWYISYDDGATWEQLGKATGEDGQDGQDGADGLDGANGLDGKDGDAFFKSIEQDEKYVYFVLADGTLITLPKERPSEYITFLDNRVELLCVLNWDTDGDQRLSYAEAAAVESLEGIFQSSDIAAFNELKFFTGLTKIEWAAFAGCKELKQISLPESILSIEGCAFEDCNLKRIVLPQSLVSIGDNVFNRCSKLESITLHEGITSLGTEAFADCESLTEVTIPQSMKTIGSKAFRGCFNLSAFYGKFASDDNRCLVGSDGHLVGFAPKGLTAYEIPNGVTVVDGFTGCRQILSITLPESVTSIADYAFGGCVALSEIVIPEGVSSIGQGAFDGLTRCIFKGSTPPQMSSLSLPRLCTVYVPEGAQTAYKEVCVWADWAKRVVEGQKRTPAANEIWYLSSDGNIVEPYDKSVFGANYQSNLYDEELKFWVITFDGPVTSVGAKAFYSSDWTYYESETLELVYLPEGVTSIGQNAFNGCKRLRYLNLPESVTSIGNAAFYVCDLQSLIIPSKVTSIAGYLIYGNSSLRTIFAKPLMPPAGGDWSSFWNINDIHIESYLYVPEESVEAYKSENGWDMMLIPHDHIFGCQF